LNLVPHGRQASKLQLAALLVVAVCALSCNRQPKPVSSLGREADHQQLTRKLERSIETAGRSQVWIRPYMGRFAVSPMPPPEARAGSEVYSAVVGALERQARENHLDVSVDETRSRKGLRVADIRLSHNRKPVSRWTIREVPRLLHAAIIIDDLGANLENPHQLLALPYALTFSILPHLSDSAETAREARHAGREVMLHLPMEPVPSPHAPPGTADIRVGMNRLEIEHVIDSDLASVPQAAGVNNHMGSRATADPRLMAAVMRSLAGRHLFFIDSRTTASSVAFDAARRQGLPAFYRSVFLDDTQSVPYTLGQLREFRRVLEEQGAALAIGHPYPTTIAALAKFLPEVVRDDVELEPASQLLQLPEVAHLKPRQRKP
jgi:polysaccharide deacetylase 2 family uncharacterized protein YibQ